MTLQIRTPSLDSLATRAKVAVVVPATNTIVQPEMEAMRPAGVTNHVTRMRLPPRPYDDQAAYKQRSGDGKGRARRGARAGADVRTPCGGPRPLHPLVSR